MKIPDPIQIGVDIFRVKIEPNQRWEGFVVSLKDNAETWASTQIEEISHAGIAIKDLAGSYSKRTVRDETS